jgi:hypothetical protein
MHLPDRQNKHAPFKSEGGGVAYQKEEVWLTRRDPLPTAVYVQQYLRPLLVSTERGTLIWIDIEHIHSQKLRPHLLPDLITQQPTEGER